MNWTLVPRALHFNIMCGDTVIYEGVTSEKQGNALVDAHNDAIAEATKPLVDALTKAKRRIAMLQSCVRSGESITAKDAPEIRAELDEFDAALAKVGEGKL